MPGRISNDFFILYESSGFSLKEEGERWPAPPQKKAAK